VIGSNCIGRY